MIYKIESVEDKSADWKVATVVAQVEGGETYEKVSINRKNRDETIAFSNFDLFKAGYVFEGSDVWPNAKGNLYIFAPKPKAQPKKVWSGKTPAAITAAQDKKAEDIETARVRKNDAIVLAAAQRDAVLMVTTFESQTPFPTNEELQEKFKEWREFFIKEHQNRAAQPF